MELVEPAQAAPIARVYGQPLLELPQDLYIPPDALEVFLEQFEGPLDLLLYLIRKENISVLDIPMAKLTAQYLEYVEMMRSKQLELAAEYLLAGGNPNVILCERGIKTFETETRNTFDLAAIALAKELSHLPVVADPSHGTGRRSLISAVSKAAVAVGADGLIVEVHPCPERALSDGPQSLDLDGFARMVRSLSEPLRRVAPIEVSVSA